jgi:hypothetical protein
MAGTRVLVSAEGDWALTQQEERVHREPTMCVVHRLRC